LKLKCDEPVPNVAVNFDLCRYIKAAADQVHGEQKDDLMARVDAGNATDSDAIDALCRCAELTALEAVAEAEAAISTMLFDTQVGR
jgi:hypothetical protein